MSVAVIHSSSCDDAPLTKIINSALRAPSSVDGIDVLDGYGVSPPTEMHSNNVLSGMMLVVLSLLLALAALRSRAGFG